MLVTKTTFELWPHWELKERGNFFLSIDNYAYRFFLQIRIRIRIRKNFLILCFTFFFREELLKSLLPIRGVFPSLLKCLYRESPTPVAEPDIIVDQPNTSPDTSPVQSSSVTPNPGFNTQRSLTYCPLCRQPSYEIVGPAPEQFEDLDCESVQPERE